MDKQHTLRMSILNEEGREMVVATIKSDVLEKVSILHNIDGISITYKQLLEEYKKYE